MQVQAPLNVADQQNEMTFFRVQTAIESKRPCIITSPPGFGQMQLLRRIAKELGRDAFHVRLTDEELCDTSKIRSIIHNLTLYDTESKENLSSRPKIELNELKDIKTDLIIDPAIDLEKGIDKNQQDDGEHKKAILIIEHDFNADSVANLIEAKKSYADAISLNRIDQVLPVLCTPVAPTLFCERKNRSIDDSTPRWLIIHSHELLTPMPLGTQQLLNSAAPHLHQSLLGIIRLAESWPSMSAMLTAKLKGLGAQQELKGQQNQSSQLYVESNDLQIPSHALKTTCSELLNNYQAIMSNLASHFLSHQEQILLAHLSLFPPNIYPFLPFIEKKLPQIYEITQSLHLKNVLVQRHDTARSQHPLLSFSSIAWRFYAQGYLRRSCSTASIQKFITDTIDDILAKKEENPEWVQSLAIEFTLSAKEYERTIELVVQQAHTKNDDSDKLQKVNQAVNWLKFIPQRLINLHPQARVLQSYHRLIAGQSKLPEQDPIRTAPSRNYEQPVTSLQKIGATPVPEFAQTHFSPRVESAPHKDHADIPISLQQVEIPKNAVRPTQASLLLDIKKHVQEHNFKQVASLAQTMIEQAFNQQKPELFLHGLSYHWYCTEATQGTQGFKKIIENCLSDSRLSTHLNEFKYWLQEINEAIQCMNALEQTPREPSLIAQPNMPHLLSLGQNILGFMTSYLNGLSALSQSNTALVKEKTQEATYHAMNLPDSFSQNLMPLWLIETFNYFQQNRIQQAIIHVQNTLDNARSGSVRIYNPFLTVVERILSSGPETTSSDILSPRLQLLCAQMETISLLWQHSYKKSDKHLLKLLKKVEQTNEGNSEDPGPVKDKQLIRSNNHVDDEIDITSKEVSLFPWIWLGPSSWYLLGQRLQGDDQKLNQNTSLELNLNYMELYYKTYTFDSAFLALSKRETEILGLVVEGCSNEEISNLLCRSLGTIKLHVHSIYKKLSASNRVNAIKKCQVSGFFGI